MTKPLVQRALELADCLPVPDGAISKHWGGTDSDQVATELLAARDPQTRIAIALANALLRLAYLDEQAADRPCPPFHCQDVRCIIRPDHEGPCLYEGPAPAPSPGEDKPIPKHCGTAWCVRVDGHGGDCKTYPPSGELSIDAAREEWEHLSQTAAIRRDP